MGEHFNKRSTRSVRRMLRKIMPKAELILWSRLRRRAILGARFRRQYSVGPYVVDFCCPALKLAVEVDGETHNASTEAYDRERQNYIEEYGIKFLRFTNVEVYDNLDGVLTRIYEAVREFGEGEEAK